MGRVLESHEFTDQAGFEYHFDLGRNDNDRRVIALYMRIVGGRVWLPVLEMDIDVAAYFRETKSDLEPPGTRDGI